MSSNRYQVPDCSGCSFCQKEKSDERSKGAANLRRLRKQVFDTILQIENHQLRDQIIKKEFECVATTEDENVIKESFLSSIMSSFPFSRLFTTSLDDNNTKVNSQTWQVPKLKSRVSPYPYNGIGMCNN